MLLIIPEAVVIKEIFKIDTIIITQIYKNKSHSITLNRQCSKKLKTLLKCLNDLRSRETQMNKIK